MATVECSTLHIETEACSGTCSTCTAVGSCSERTVCRCLKIAEDAIIDAIRTDGAASVRDLQRSCGAGKGCMACHSELKKYLRTYAAAAPAKRAQLTVASH